VVSFTYVQDQVMVVPFDNSSGGSYTRGSGSDHSRRRLREMIA
jgi:hypothetical protein